MKDTNTSENASQTDILSMAIHRLRTPLSRVKWSLDSIIHDTSRQLSDTDKEMLHSIYEDNEHAINMINDVLRLYQQENTSSNVHPVKANVIELIDQVLHDTQGDASTKGVSLMFEKNKNIVLPILTDPRMFVYVFENLILNAIHYTPQGGLVSIHTQTKDDAVLISVADNGIGIPEREQSHIFEKFFRATNAQKMEGEGTGLGLFISRSAVETYGGKIWFESEENKGTTFWLSFPLMTMVQ